MSDRPLDAPQDSADEHLSGPTSQDSTVPATESPRAPSSQTASPDAPSSQTASPQASSPQAASPDALPPHAAPPGDLPTNLLPTNDSPANPLPSNTTVDVAVIGGGVGGLTAARELARRGYDVLLLEASAHLGGPARNTHIDGLGTVATGASAIACRAPDVAASVRELTDELGLDTTELPASNPDGVALRIPGGTVPMPSLGPLGIPTSPLATDVIAALGGGGAFRAFADRLMPFLKVGVDATLGPLVRRRMGQLVLDRLVAPAVGGSWGAPAELLDVDQIAPGLNQAITRAGTLSGGAAFYADRPAPPRLGLPGGTGQLVDALAADLRHWRGEIRTETEVRDVTESNGEWTLATSAGSVTARSLVVATSARIGTELLRHVDGAADVLLGWHDPSDVVVFVAELDDATTEHRATIVARDVDGLAVDSASISNDRRVRAIAGRGGSATGTHLDLDAMERDALKLLAGRGSATQRVAFSHQLEAPHAALGGRDRIAKLREWARREDHAPILVVGAWVAGTRIGDIIADVRAEHVELRRERFAHPGDSWPEREAAAEQSPSQPDSDAPADSPAE